MIALAIAAVLFSAVVVGLGAITGAKAKSATSELSAVIRSLYDTANLTGKTCRLVFELPQSKDDETPVSYRAECAERALTTSRKRDETLREAAEEREAQAKGETKKPSL